MRRTAKKLWGGRFTQPTSRVVERFTQSLSVDRRLARYDLLVSIAHATMLGKTGIIPRLHSQRLVRTLKELLRLADQDRLKLDSSAEDIHTAIQILLEKKAGASAQYLHTARSRNDQVVTSLRIYCREMASNLELVHIPRLQKAILDQASEATQAHLVMPGFTHLRHAQPVLVGHILLSYVTMLQRDQERLEQADDRIDELPLGSGALVGTGLPINRTIVARQLRFARLAENSVDAVTDRDFVVDLLAAMSLLGVHLSRIAEDLILWSTKEFGFVEFDESLLTGSSMMPQKQNPDFLELIRARSSRLIGNLTSILTLLKGLASGYQRDFQLDKEILFESLDGMEEMLSLMAEGFRGIQWNKKNLKSQLEDESLYATDTAEYLVEKGVPFAKAHRAVGKLLSYSNRKGIALKSIPQVVFQRFSPAFRPDVYRILNPTASVQRKKSTGSTNPRLVREAIRRWRRRLSRKS